MSIYTVLFFGLVPSIIWLLFFLKKDAHPEPKPMILKLFVFGMASAVIAALIEIALFNTVLSPIYESFNINAVVFFLIYHFLAIAFVEEGLKYMVVRQSIINDPEFDEPVDAMFYMIIVALGFAALENILVLLPIGEFFFDAVSVSALRFIGATFLHALASATIGFFLALSFCDGKRRRWLVLVGILIATALHGVYNISIIKADENFYYILIPIILLSSLAIFVSFGIRKLKRLASTCKVVKRKTTSVSK